MNLVDAVYTLDITANPPATAAAPFEYVASENVYVNNATPKTRSLVKLVVAIGYTAATVLL